jgi:hypothetical protein
MIVYEQRNTEKETKNMCKKRERHRQKSIR